MLLVINSLCLAMLTGRITTRFIIEAGEQGRLRFIISLLTEQA